MLITQLLNYFYEFFAEQLGLYTYQNYFEILILSFFIYKILQWLAQDYTKPLLLYWYGYYAILTISYYCNALTLFWIMIIASPIAAMFILFIHQTKLQKQFILHSNQTFNIQSLPNQQWPEILIRALLFATHHQKQIFCIIERNNTIDSLLLSPYDLNIPIQPNVTDFLLSSTLLENPTIMIINHHGFIKNINVTWSKNMHDHLLINEHHTTKQHNQEAGYIITKKTDAFMFHIEAHTYLATLWINGTIIQNLSIDQLLITCNEILPQKSTDIIKKGIFHVQKHRNNNTSPENY